MKKTILTVGAVGLAVAGSVQTAKADENGLTGPTKRANNTGSSSSPDSNNGTKGRNSQWINAPKQ